MFAWNKVRRKDVDFTFRCSQRFTQLVNDDLLIFRNFFEELLGVVGNQARLCNIGIHALLKELFHKGRVDGVTVDRIARLLHFAHHLCASRVNFLRVVFLE